MSDFGYIPSVSRYANVDALYKTSIPFGTSNSKGSYTELIASTPFDGMLLLAMDQLMSSHAGGSLIHGLLDIAVGGAGSEQVIVSDVFRGAWGLSGLPNRTDMDVVLIPLTIPAGSRIAMRGQVYNAGVQPCVVKAQLLGGNGLMPFGRSATYGATTGSSSGTTVTAGNGSKGSYFELSAATTNKFDWLLLTCVNRFTSTQAVDAEVALDLAVGAASSEEVIVPDLYFNADFSGETYPQVYQFFVSVPLGSRLSARARASVAGVELSIAVVGFG